MLCVSERHVPLTARLQISYTRVSVSPFHLEVGGRRPDASHVSPLRGPERSRECSGAWQTSSLWPPPTSQSPGKPGAHFLSPDLKQLNVVFRYELYSWGQWGNHISSLAWHVSDREIHNPADCYQLQFASDWWPWVPLAAVAPAGLRWRYAGSWSRRSLQHSHDVLTLSIACCRWLLGSGHCSLLPLPPPWLPVSLVQISVLMALWPVPTPYIIELEMGVFGGNQNRAGLQLLHDFLQEVLQLTGDGLVEDHLLTSSCDVEVEHCEVYHYSRCSRPSRPISTENIADPCDPPSIFQ